MKYYLYIVAAMFIWSTWGLLIRWMALPAVVVLFYTSLIASITVPAALKLRGEFSPLQKSDSWGLFTALLLASLANNLTYFYSLAHTTVSNAVFTHYTAPVLVALLAPVVISERLERTTLISLPIGVAGMAMIMVSSGGLHLDGVHTRGIIAGTASGVAYAFVIMISRSLSSRLQHHKAVMALIWATTLVTAPIALSVEYRMTAQAFIMLFITGVMHSTTAPLMYFNALRKVKAQHAAILGYIEPFSAIPLAFLFLNETPSVIALAGGLLVLFSGYLVVYFAKKQPGSVV